MYVMGTHLNHLREAILISCEAILMSTHNMFLWRNDENYPSTRICFLCENWCLPPIGVMQFCTESQVLVQQKGINSESKVHKCVKYMKCWSCISNDTKSIYNCYL